MMQFHCQVKAKMQHTRQAYSGKLSPQANSDSLPQAMFIHTDAFGSGLVLVSSLCSGSTSFGNGGLMQLGTSNKAQSDSAEKDLFATHSQAKPWKESQILWHHRRTEQTRCLSNLAHMRGSAPAITAVLIERSDVLGCWVNSHHILHMC